MCGRLFEVRTHRLVLRENEHGMRSVSGMVRSRRRMNMRPLVVCLALSGIWTSGVSTPWPTVSMAERPAICTVLPRLPCCQ